MNEIRVPEECWPLRRIFVAAFVMSIRGAESFQPYNKQGR
jgi:hypothetical protein